MLTVEKRFMIKELHRRGVSISEIARLTGHDRKTVRLAVSEGLVRSAGRRKRRVRKLDPYVSYLEQRIEQGVLNAQKLYAEIKAQGYEGGVSLVKSFVQPHRAARTSQTTVRFETEPGQQAQVDWAYFGMIWHQGRQMRLYGFAMTLGWSRAMYLEFTVSSDTTWFLRCHLHAFRYLGGVPHEVLHDNLKSAVLNRDNNGAIHWNPRYLDFANYYGFVPHACQPYRPQTKGKVERGIRYVQGNFWPGLTYSDLDDLNRQRRQWLDTVANVRIHGTTGAVPFDRLPQEGLQTLLGKPDYDTSYITSRRSTRDCLISYGGNHYSIPAAYACQHLLVRETEGGELIIATTVGEEIARHSVVAGRQQRIVVPAHYQDIPVLSQRRQQAQATQKVMPASDWPLAPAVEVRPLQWYEQVAEASA